MRRSLSASRRLASLLLCLFTLLGLALQRAGSASAHAYLATSNPADGADLSTAPAELRLDFSESVVLGATTVRVVDSAQHAYPVTNLRLVGGVSGETEAPVSLYGKLPPLGRGAYRLDWATLSRDDLHRTSGVIVFGIGQNVTAAGSPEPRPPAEEVWLRWLLLAGFAAGLGGVLGAELMHRAGAGRVAARRALLLAAGAAGVSAVAAAALLLRQAGGIGLLGALSGRYGLGWLVREVGLLCLGSAALAQLRWPARLSFRNVQLIIAVAECGIGSALVGHDSAAGPLTILAGAVHLISVSAWVGPLLVVLLCCPAGRRSTALRAFGPLAAASVGAAVISGVYLMAGVVGSVDAGLATFYGRVLSLKLALFAAAGLLGWANHRRLRRRGRAAGATLYTELGVLTAVLALAAVLTSSQPAREPQYVQAARPAASTGVDGLAADLQLTAGLKPNRPGSNIVLVHVFDTRRPAPAQITAVRIRLQEPGGPPSSSLSLQPAPDAAWTGTVQLAAARQLRLELVISRAGLPDVTAGYPWIVGQPPVPAHPTILSRAPLAVPLRILAATLSVAAMLLALFALRGREPEPTPVPAAVLVGAE